jgi:class 3 adenylate cyclase
VTAPPEDVPSRAVTEPTTATMTLLFTDIVASTALYDRLGAAATDDLRRAQFAVLRNALGGHNGTEVKSTGDGLMVAFASAADAVACAVDMQRGLADLRRSDGRVPGTRIGLSVGEATLEDDDWYGPPVVEAARLCALAEADQILTSALVTMLVGRRSEDANYEFVDVGPRDLKGFTTPVDVREVAWVRDTAAVPPPYQMAAAAFGPFVGRDSELDALTDAWKQGRGLLLVGGEPGIGKTRTVAELATRVHADGGVVLWGRNDEDLAVPYQPFVEALRHLVDNAPAEVLAAGAPRPDLARLVPELKERWPDLPPPVMADPDIERLRMFDAVAGFLAGIARTAPMLVVLDDLHWATAPTLLLLRYLTREGQQPPGVVIAATYRDTELDRAHPLANMLAELRRQPGVARVALGGLDADAVADLVDATGGDAGIAAAVYDETEGNPFFVGEVLRHFAETGSAGGVPEGVREVIGNRLSRLSGAANKVLAVAAAVGPEADLDLLERIPDAADTGAVLDALEEAANARLITELPRPVGRFAFTHALVRQTLYAELSAARRARLHFRIAAAMAALPPEQRNSAAVAHHYAEGAAAGGIVQAIEWAGHAAVDARARLAFEEAAAHRERAIQLFDLQPDADPRDRLELVAEYLSDLRTAGDIDAVKRVAVELGDSARALGDARMLALGAVAKADWGLAGIVDEATEAGLLEAIAAVDGLDTENGPWIKAQLLAILAFYRAIYLGEGTRVSPLLDEADALTRGAPPSAAGRVQAMRCFVLQGSPDIDAQDRANDAVAALAADTKPDTFSWGPGTADVVGLLDITHLRHWPITALQRGDLAGFDRGLEAMRAERANMGGWFAAAFDEMWTAMRCLVDGRVDEAEAASNRILSHTDDINFFNSWAGQMFAINRERGTIASVRDLFVDAAAQTPGIVALQAIVALAAAELGELDEARRCLDALMSDPDTTFAPNSILPGTLAHLTNVAYSVGPDAAPAAQQLLDELLPYSGQLLVIAWGVTCEGAADRYIGMCLSLLGRATEAREYLECALALERAIGAGPFVARTESVLADLG